MKKLLVLVLVLSLALSFAACNAGGSEATASESQASSSETVSSDTGADQSDAVEPTKKAAMISAQKLGDGGVTDDTYDGFIRGCEDFGYEPTMVEVEAGEYEETLRALCEEGYDLIMPCWSALEDACATVAGEYPESSFIMVFSEIDVPNVKSLMSAQADGSYLAGIAAAMTAQSGHIGFIGGSDNPQINKFRAGYEAGAQSVNPDIQVDVAWVGSFSDPAKAKELALMLYDQDCEIVFVAAGGSSNGVFEAAEETGGLVIGCDVDQSEIVPGQVIGSMVINYGDWVYSCFEEANSADGLQYGVYYFGLEGNHMGFLFPAEATYATDPAIVTAVEEAQEKILSGEIVVPMS